MKQRIAMVVHGRFHAFDLSRELLRQGQEVTVFTNYPARLGPTFGIPADRMRPFVSHGVMTRAWSRVARGRSHEGADRVIHEIFGRWAARQVAGQEFDAFHAFSGVAEELLLSESRALKTMVRGSAHIALQASLLEEEERRIGSTIERPTSWMIARELREYAMAQSIYVLSNFAKQSFIQAGVPENRLVLLPLGSELGQFKASAQAHAARLQRIRRGERLRVLYVGNFSAQKGAVDFAAVVRALGGRLQFRVVGAVATEAQALARSMQPQVEMRGKVPHYELPAEYEWADLFFFPTIQDGYAMVLAQAMASGLPLLATTNCAGPDLIDPGRTGWIIPIRTPEAAITHLDWCDQHRPELAEIVQEAYESDFARDWSAVATDFVDSLEATRAPKAST